MSKHWEQNKDATVYVGNIDERFTQELLSELMAQVGPVRQVHMPQDRVSQTHQGYGFVEFDTPASAEYASKVLNGIRIWGKPIRVNKASADKQKTVDIGAELFINNLDPQVDEKILYDTFSQFGQILRQPNIVRDDNNISKGYGFVSFDSFEASDAAVSTMNGQYLLSKAITVEYAYKKDGKGERHGDEAERKLAAEGKKHNIVPEQQVLPPAFHMSAAPPAASAGPTPTTATQQQTQQQQPPNIDPSAGIPPSPVAPLSAGMPPNGPPYGPPGGGLPHGGLGRGGPPPSFGGGHNGPPARAPPIASAGLPPAPSGLPARPPPSHAGFGGPVGGFPHHHPPPAGFPGAPSSGGPPGAGGPPSAAGHQPPMYPGMPPPGAGFPGGPPPGFIPPPGAPGAVPGAPPGFGAPPPAGFGRR